MIFDTRTQLLLASDVDETLLAYDQVLNGALLSVVNKLLASNRLKLVIITGNDYVNQQKQRVVDPIPADLRKNLIVYADGCTRKLNFTASGQEALDEAYRRTVKFDRDDKERVQNIVRRKVQEWSQRYPTLNTPDVYVEVLDKGIQIKIGPLGVSDDVSLTWQDRLCEQIEEKLAEDCTDIQIILSDELWVRVRCVIRQESITPDYLKQQLEQLMVRHFTGLSTPAIIDRAEQLALKPVKPRLRPELTCEIRALVSGTERHTNQEYDALIGGRATIDIQKAGVDKAFAIKDLQRTFTRSGTTLYFGNAFEPSGNDHPVASVEGVTCVNVGLVKDVPKSVINLGGGPAMTLAYFRGILWALSGQTG